MPVFLGNPEQIGRWWRVAMSQHEMKPKPTMHPLLSVMMSNFLFAKEIMKLVQSGFQESAE